MGGGTKAKEDFAQNRASKIKLGAIRGATEETAHFGALPDLRPSVIRSARACPVRSLHTFSSGENFHLMEHARLGGAKGHSGFLSWQHELDRASGTHD